MLLGICTTVSKFSKQAAKSEFFDLSLYRWRQTEKLEWGVKVASHLSKLNRPVSASELRIWECQVHWRFWKCIWMWVHRCGELCFQWANSLGYHHWSRVTIKSYMNSRTKVHKHHQPLLYPLMQELFCLLKMPFPLCCDSSRLYSFAISQLEESLIAIIKVMQNTFTSKVPYPWIWKWLLCVNIHCLPTV